MSIRSYCVRQCIHYYEWYLEHPFIKPDATREVLLYKAGEAVAKHRRVRNIISIHSRTLTFCRDVAVYDSKPVLNTYLLDKLAVKAAIAIKENTTH